MKIFPTVAHFCNYFFSSCLFFSLCFFKPQSYLFVFHMITNSSSWGVFKVSECMWNIMLHLKSSLEKRSLTIFFGMLWNRTSPCDYHKCATGEIFGLFPVSKHEKNGQNLGCFFEIIEFFGIVPGPLRLPQVRRKRNFFEF